MTLLQVQTDQLVRFNVETKCPVDSSVIRHGMQVVMKQDEIIM